MGLHERITAPQQITPYTSSGELMARVTGSFVINAPESLADAEKIPEDRIQAIAAIHDLFAEVFSEASVAQVRALEIAEMPGVRALIFSSTECRDLDGDVSEEVSQSVELSPENQSESAEPEEDESYGVFGLQREIIPHVTTVVFPVDSSQGKPIVLVTTEGTEYVIDGSGSGFNSETAQAALNQLYDGIQAAPVPVLTGDSGELAQKLSDLNASKVRLSPHEMQVWQALAPNKKYADIATEVGIDVSEVYPYINRLRRKLGCGIEEAIALRNVAHTIGKTLAVRPYTHREHGAVVSISDTGEVSAEEGLVLTSDETHGAVAEQTSSERALDGALNTEVPTTFPSVVIVTPQQHAIWELLTEGLRPSAIAQQLNLSEKTVHVHMVGLYGRLGVNKRADAIALFAASQAGLVRVNVGKYTRRASLPEDVASRRRKKAGSGDMFPAEGDGHPDQDQILNEEVVVFSASQQSADGSIQQTDGEEQVIMHTRMAAHTRDKGVKSKPQSHTAHPDRSAVAGKSKRKEIFRSTGQGRAVAWKDSNKTAPQPNTVFAFLGVDTSNVQQGNGTNVPYKQSSDTAHPAFISSETATRYAFLQEEQLVTGDLLKDIRKGVRVGLFGRVETPGVGEMLVLLAVADNVGELQEKLHTISSRTSQGPKLELISRLTADLTAGYINTAKDRLPTFSFPVTVAEQPLTIVCVANDTPPKQTNKFPQDIHLLLTQLENSIEK